MAELQSVTCQHRGDELVGQAAWPAGEEPCAVVLVFPSAIGLGDHALAAVARLTEAGYLALGVDMYGGGLASGYTDADKTGARFAELTADPELLRERAQAWLATARHLPRADPARIAAIGYCFGGFCVLELARSGADLAAVVSYHGLLKTQAPAPPGAIRAEVAAYCGARDPYAPVSDVDALREELTAAGARYQITLFGEAEHGFTDPRAGEAGRPGIAFDETAMRVSWAGTLALFAALL